MCPASDFAGNAAAQSMRRSQRRRQMMAFNRRINCRLRLSVQAPTCSPLRPSRSLLKRRPLQCRSPRQFWSRVQHPGRKKNRRRLRAFPGNQPNGACWYLLEPLRSTSRAIRRQVHEVRRIRQPEFLSACPQLRLLWQAASWPSIFFTNGKHPWRPRQLRRVKTRWPEISSCPANPQNRRRPLMNLRLRACLRPRPESPHHKLRHPRTAFSRRKRSPGNRNLCAQFHRLQSLPRPRCSARG